MENNNYNNYFVSLLNEADRFFHENNYVESSRSLDIIERGIAGTQTDKKVEMKMTNFKGLISLNQGDFATAELYLLRSLRIAEEIGEPKFIYNRYDNLASLYMETKKFVEAMNYLERSIALKGANGNERDMARGLIQMANILLLIENYPGSKQAIEKASVLIKKYDIKELLMSQYFAMVMHLKREGKYEEALIAYEKTQNYARQYNDVTILTRSYNNQADILMKMERWQDASEKYHRALEIASQYNLVVDQLSIYTQLAAVALKMGDLKECQTKLDLVSEHLIGVDDDILIKDFEEVRAMLFEAQGKLPEALNAYRRHVKYYKQYYDNEQSRTILDIHAKYENEKREKELQQAKLQQVESELKALRAENALREREVRFKYLIENGVDMISVIDTDLKPRYASPAVFKTLGYTDVEYYETALYEIIHPGDLPHVSAKLVDVLKNQDTPILLQLRIRLKDNSYIWVEGTATNLLHVEAINGIVFNVNDITERKKKEIEIQDLNRSLEQKIADRTSDLEDAVKELESFSYSVSHDLRSPLRILSGYSILLMEEWGDQMSPEAREYITAIIDNSKRMGQLINDLLNLSYLGKEAVNREEIDMTDIAMSVADEIQLEDLSMKHKIIIHTMRNAICDRGLVKQVWTNLISNAVKYSKKCNEPIIEIGSFEKDHETIYYVKDNGVGFDMKFAHRLFGVFQRLHFKSDFDGTGVGLAIVHRIISKHGGRVWAESTVNEGATFYFTLMPQA
jgi:PAS domain S-box-containing protein